ncbi:MAG: helix-turn-helix transcriptional regulator [Lachnospiraceae bacterium]|nr:helix-turn-helix transcriptional regulator [Lachnospiraceae bacterium]
MKYQRIKDLREDTNLNQTEFAKIIGMSQTGYSKYETGENDVPTTILIKLADYYNTSIDYILGRTDEHTPYPPSKSNFDE